MRHGATERKWGLRLQGRAPGARKFVQVQGPRFHLGKQRGLLGFVDSRGGGFQRRSGSGWAERWAHTAKDGEVQGPEQVTLTSATCSLTDPQAVGVTRTELGTMWSELCSRKCT